MLVARLEERAELQRSQGVRVVATAPSAGVRSDDVAGAVVCWQDGVADPLAVARELVRRAAAGGVEVTIRATGERSIVPLAEVEASLTG